MNKKLLMFITILGLTAGIGSFGYAYQVHAQNQARQDYSPVVQKLIEKFNLDTAEVDKVLEEVHSERQAQMRQNLEDRLNQAVTDGKVNSDQKEFILNKLSEEHANREDMRNLSEEERKAVFEKHREEMQQWESDNGINLKDILGNGDKGYFKMRGMHGGW